MTAATKPPHPASPTRGEGPRRARDNRTAPNRPVASLPPLWGRVGEGGLNPTTKKSPK